LAEKKKRKKFVDKDPRWGRSGGKEELCEIRIYDTNDKRPREVNVLRDRIGRKTH